MSFNPTLIVKSAAAFGLFASTLAIGSFAGRSPAEEPAQGNASAPESGLLSLLPTFGPSSPVQPVARVATEGDILTVSADPDRGSILSGEKEVRVRLTLSAQAPAGVDVATSPTDLIIVLDTSGSMEGEKLEEAKAAIAAMTGLLDPGDRLGLLRYSGDVSWAIPLQRTDDADRSRWTSVVSELRADGATNIGAALEEAHRAVEEAKAPGKVSRVVLLSDGQPTAGLLQQPEELIKLAERAGPAGYSLSALGFGDDYNESLMAGMADRGQGNFYYIRGGEDLHAVFEGEFEAARRTVAEGVAITLEVPEGVEVVEVSGYPLEHVAGGVSFYPGTFFDGQTRTLWATLKVSPGMKGAVSLGAVSAKWRAVGDGAAQVAMAPMGAVSVAQDQEAFVASLNADVWAQGVAEEGLGSLQQEVSEAVRNGDKALALQKIESYRAKNAALNATVSSPLVQAQLTSLGYMGVEVEDAFQGANQMAKQNVLTKKALCNGLDTRRAGSKYIK